MTTIKLSLNVKKLPSLDALYNLKWYVVFVGTLTNINSIESLTNQKTFKDSIVWAPTFQEYCKLRSHLILVDRLIYPGYIFVGFVNDHQLASFLKKVSAERKGTLLGDGVVCLLPDEVKDVFSVAVKYSTAPKVMFDVKPGDHVTISSGPLSGLPAQVRDIKPSGDVTLTVFFLSRELTVKTTILDIQSFGYARTYNHD